MALSDEMTGFLAGRLVEVLFHIMAGLAALGLSGGLGYLAGKACRGRSAILYWAANAVGFISGIALSAAGAFHGVPLYWAAGVGVMTGSVTGLKYGLGRVTGLRTPGGGVPGGTNAGS